MGRTGKGSQIGYTGRKEKQWNIIIMVKENESTRRHRFLTETKKEELFRKAVQAYDNYTRAVEYDLPDFQNYYSAVAKELLVEIKRNNLLNEFEEFALVG